MEPAEIVKAALLLRQVKMFIMPTLESCPIIIMEKNQGTRHIDVEHHFVRGTVEAGRVRIIYVKTENQHTDVLTKVLEKARLINR